MYDEYEPIPPIDCPACGDRLEGWQGKDGPCALLVWRQGEASQVRRSVDEERAAALRGERLPDAFRLYAGCRRGHWVEADGRSVNGVWTSTSVVEISGPDSFEPVPALHCPLCGEQLDHWRDADGTSSGRLWLWRQGDREPHPWPVPPELIKPDFLSPRAPNRHLESEFDFYAVDGQRHQVLARGVASERTWVRTDLVSVRRAFHGPIMWSATGGVRGVLRGWRASLGRLARRGH